MTQPESTPSDPASDSPAHELEEYAGGYIKARVGRIPAWMLVVYAVLFIWALYYTFAYWGGRQTDKATGLLVARIIFALAALNLLFLFSEITMNVVGVYFG